jgi:hypothetical protein
MPTNWRKTRNLYPDISCRMPYRRSGQAAVVVEGNAIWFITTTERRGNVMKISRIALLAASVTLLVSGLNGSAAEAAGPSRTVEMREAVGPRGVLEPRGTLGQRGVGSPGATSVSGALVSVRAQYPFECGLKLSACMADKTGYNLSCGVAAWQIFDGMSNACQTALKSLGGACPLAANYCNDSGDNAEGYVPPPKTLSSVGSMSNTAFPLTSGTCPRHAWVDRMTIFWSPSYKRVIKLVFHCTPINGVATNIPLGINDGPLDQYTTTITCHRGELVSGMLFRAGTELDAAGVVCGKVANVDETAYTAGIYGGQGGSRQDRACPRDKYIIGARVRSEFLRRETDNIAGVELICR